MTEFALKSSRVLTSPAQPPRPMTVVVRDGRIAEIAAAAPHGPRTEDLGDALLMAGLVDTHAHLNEPGRTEWEGFATATRAAAAGGITTLVDMPLNSLPPTTTLAALEAKRASARGQCAIDCAFWGGVIPGNSGELEPLIRAGVVGFKCFLSHSGVDEFPKVSESDLRVAMPILARAGVPLIAHAELETAALAPGPPSTPQTHSRHYHDYLASRPGLWEVEAIRLLIRLSRETGCRVHIVHLSAADALPDLAQARREGVAITAETCPHYLTFCSEEVPDGATHYKCAPPIRERANRERLWTALQESWLDLVVSDHSPCTPALKRLETGDFGQAWGGIAGLQFGLPAIWSGMRARGIPIERITGWMSAAPARLAGLDGKKGGLEVGNDADLVVWNPEASFAVARELVRHRHPLTPYEGLQLFGQTLRTYVRGRLVYAASRQPGLETTPVGELLERGPRHANS